MVPWCSELATSGFAQPCDTDEPAGAMCLIHFASSGHTQQGTVAGGLQSSEVRLTITKPPVVLGGHALKVQNIKKLHPSCMCSLSSSTH